MSRESSDGDPRDGCDAGEQGEEPTGTSEGTLSRLNVIVRKRDQVGASIGKAPGS
jgi:hypothetical protein